VSVVGVSAAASVAAAASLSRIQLSS